MRRTLLLRSLIGLSLGIALTMNVSVSHSDEPTLDDLVAHFDNLVFGSEISGVAGARHIQKWVSPIRVSISNLKGTMRQTADGGRNLKLDAVKPAPAHVEMIRRHLTTLVRATGVANEKSDAAAGKKANFLIKFMPRLAMGQPFVDKDVAPALLARLARPGVCYFIIKPIRTGALFRALIVVNNELPQEQMDACLLEEMTQAMGLPNDSDIVRSSVFNQRSTQRTLSQSDVVLLKTLYDRRLPAGTPRQDALRIARDLIQARLNGG